MYAPQSVAPPGPRRLAGLRDRLLRVACREAVYRAALIEQGAIAPGHRVLDLGCGGGGLAVAIKQAQPAAEVIGIDAHPPALAAVRSAVQRAGVAIRFDRGPGGALPYAEASFDRVLSGLYFHRLDREGKLESLGEVLRVLKPWGELHLADWGAPTGPVMGALSLVEQSLDAFVGIRDNRMGLLPLLMERAGFQDVQETLVFPTVLGTLSLFWGRRPG